MFCPLIPIRGAIYYGLYVRPTLSAVSPQPHPRYSKCPCPAVFLRTVGTTESMLRMSTQASPFSFHNTCRQYIQSLWLQQILLTHNSRMAY